MSAAVIPLFCAPLSHVEQRAALRWMQGYTVRDLILRRQRNGGRCFMVKGKKA